MLLLSLSILSQQEQNPKKNGGFSDHKFSQAFQSPLKTISK
jgi:hypothetical protein